MNASSHVQHALNLCRTLRDDGVAYRQPLPRISSPLFRTSAGEFAPQLRLSVSTRAITHHPIMHRRDFIDWLIATGGIATLGRLSADDLLTLGRDAHAGQPDATAPVLDARAMATVIAAAERILPRTDTAGATDAGVGAFIDVMLGRWYGAADRDRFVAGLTALDARSRDRDGATFVALGAAAQEAVLATFDADVATLRRDGAPDAATHWFAMLKYLTVWGYCTSEVAMRDVLHGYPLPMRYDGNAPMPR